MKDEEQSIEVQEVDRSTPLRNFVTPSLAAAAADLWTKRDKP